MSVQISKLKANKKSRCSSGKFMFMISPKNLGNNDNSKTEMAAPIYLQFKFSCEQIFTNSSGLNTKEVGHKGPSVVLLKPTLICLS